MSLMMKTIAPAIIKHLSIPFKATVQEIDLYMAQEIKWRRARRAQQIKEMEE